MTLPSDILDHDGGWYEGSQRSKLPVAASYAGSGTSSTNMPFAMREILFSSKTSASLTLTGNNGFQLTFPLEAGEVFDERVPDFTNVYIATSGNWRFWVRSGIVQ